MAHLKIDGFQASTYLPRPEVEREQIGAIIATTTPTSPNRITGLADLAWQVHTRRLGLPERDSPKTTPDALNMALLFAATLPDKLVLPDCENTSVLDLSQAIEEYTDPYESVTALAAAHRIQSIAGRMGEISIQTDLVASIMAVRVDTLLLDEGMRPSDFLGRNQPYRTFLGHMNKDEVRGRVVKMLRTGGVDSGDRRGV